MGSPSGKKPELQKPPEEAQSHSLFKGSGPVSLSSGKRETITLGNIAQSQTYSSIQSPGMSPMPEPAGPPPILTPPPLQQTRPKDMQRPAEQTQETATIYREPVRMPSKPTTWSTTEWHPKIGSSSYVHPTSAVTGNVRMGNGVFVASGVTIRGDNDQPIFIGDECNIQESVVIKDMPTVKDGQTVAQRIVDVGSEQFSVYIGNRVSICAQALVHGPAYIAENVYIGMQSLVFWARIESGVVIEPGCLIMNVTIPSGVFVPAGLKVTSQKSIRDLPALTTKYRFYGINEETVRNNLEMLKGYKSLSE